MKVTIRFYEELIFFLPVEKRKRPFSVQLQPRQSVKDLIESLNIENVTRLRPLSLRTPAFALDMHLGKLARYLRRNAY